MQDRLIDLVLGLIPQKDDDAMKLYSWRWKSVVLGFSALVLASYAANVVPLLAPPYAMADTMKSQNRELQGQLDVTNRKLDTTNMQLTNLAAQFKDGQVRGLNSDLIDARRYQCRSINTTDKAALPFWTGRLQSLKLTYLQMTGETWPDLPCDSF